MTEETDGPILIDGRPACGAMLSTLDGEGIHLLICRLAPGHEGEHQDASMRKQKAWK